MSPTGESSTGRIRFACSNCGKRLSVPPSLAGQQGQCPICREVIVAPRPTPSPAPPPNNQVVQFHCSHCGHGLSAKAELAGRAVRCPKCKEAMRVPSGEPEDERHESIHIDTGEQQEKAIPPPIAAPSKTKQYKRRRHRQGKLVRKLWAKVLILILAALALPVALIAFSLIISMLGARELASAIVQMIDAPFDVLYTWVLPPLMLVVAISMGLVWYRGKGVSVEMPWHHPAFPIMAIFALPNVLFVAGRMLQHVRLTEAGAAVIAVGHAIVIWYIWLLLPACMVVGAYGFSRHKARRLHDIAFHSIVLVVPFIFWEWLMVQYFLAGRHQGAELAVEAGVIGVFFVVPWYFLARWPARWLAPYITAMLVRRLVCPGCHEAFELVDVCKCSCGYVDHRPQNCLLFRCPQCSKRFGHMECPRCESTILF